MTDVRAGDAADRVCIDPSDRRLADIPTPALILHEPTLDANLAHMARFAAQRGTPLRPHAKSHKCAEIAKRQLALGALGVCCATLAEAQDLAKAGVTGIVVTSPIAGDQKCRWLAALNDRYDIAAVVDDPGAVSRLAGLATGRPLRLLVDVDVGQERTGVVDIPSLVALATRIAAAPSLRFAGIQGYAGHVQHIPDGVARRQAAEAVAAQLSDAVAELRRCGLDPAIVTGAGTGSSDFDLGGGVFSEAQVGSYALMDSEYRTVHGIDGAGLPFRQSFYVLATVVSRRPGQVTVDAGTKALAVNGPPPDHIVGLRGLFRFRYGGDEHGIILSRDETALPSVGSRVLIAPTHCDPTVNLHPAYHAIGADGSIGLWPILGRYRATDRL